MWAQLIGTGLGGLLVLATNFVVARQQHSFEHRKMQLELKERLRGEKFKLIEEFWRTARVLEGWAVTLQEQHGTRPRQGQAWDDFWNVHVLLESVMSDENCVHLNAFADRLRRAVRNDNQDEPVWAYLKPSRIELRHAFRRELEIYVA
ncbi:hypothetical protein KIH74_13380 [Kineosporia sp. J2-2]|uniref:Uncharacterized protein n=1 Tax=Kineosporia corallincola TaxID=2835133 RepID=A0ABS5TFQ9_9ACTN|nr:hypothetical protein [Kineosporia corallincola]MBT0769923.1 hypothetical protein [Kineosporia corallincola]